MRLLRILAAAAVLTAFATVPGRAQTGYALYTNWKSIKLDLKACKQTAENALRKSAFTGDITRTENSIYARRKGGYTAGIRCVVAKEMVFFVISGPKGSAASSYVDIIFDNF